MKSTWLLVGLLGLGAALGGWLLLMEREDRGAVAARAEREAVRPEAPEVAGVSASEGAAPVQRSAVDVAAEPAPPAAALAAAEAPPEPADTLVRASLFGRVVDTEGAPIRGAEVVVPGGAGPIELARSDADGVFEAALAADAAFLRRAGTWARQTGIFDVQILAHGYEGREVEVHPRDGDAIQLGTFVLPRGAEVRGRVVDEAGLAVAGVSVRWYPAERYPEDPALARERGPGGRWSGAFVPFARSGAGGAYRLRGLPLGSGFVAGEATGTAWGWTGLLDLRAEDVVELELVVQRRETKRPIAGVVLRPDGTPLAGAEVRIGLPFRSPARATTDEEGRFSVRVLDDTPRPVVASDAHARWYPAQVDGVAPGTEDLVLRLGEPRWLAIRVVDPEGREIPWSHVRAVDRSLFPLTDTGESGLARVLRPRQSFKLEAFASGYRTERFGPFDPAALGDELTCSLRPGQAVRGRVLFQGEPVPNARVAVCRSFADLRGMLSRGVTRGDRPFTLLGRSEPGRHDATTDAEGAFVTSLHNDGWYTLRVEADGFPPAVRGPFEWKKEAGAGGLVVELARAGAIEGRVRTAPGTAAAGTLVGASNGWGVAHTTAADADGWFRIEGLEPGGWQLRPCVPPVSAVQRLSGLTTDAPVEAVWDCRVRAGETTRCDLDLTGDGAFELVGTLRLDGVSTEGWTALLHGDEARGPAPRYVFASARMDDEGRFQIALSRGGSYLLELTGAGTTLYRQVELFEGQNTSDTVLATGTLRLERPAAVRARGGFGASAVFRWSGDGVVYLHWFPWEDAVARVPAGPGAIVRRAPAKDLAPNALADDAWLPIRDVHVPAGGEVTVELD